LFVFAGKHEKNCKKNPDSKIKASQTNESIAIKA
jgi:hypothetical protein